METLTISELKPPAASSAAASNEVEEVKGLDFDDEDVLYIRSNKGVKVFKLELKEWEFSTLLKTTFENPSSSLEYPEEVPFLVSDASDEHLELIVRYLRLCASRGEKDSPEKPLPRDTLPNILGADYEIFSSILESKVETKEQIALLSDLIMAITYFDIIKFREKTCAAMASMFVGKTIDEIRMMVDHVVGEKSQ